MRSTGAASRGGVQVWCPACGRPDRLRALVERGILRARAGRAGGPYYESPCQGCARVLIVEVARPEGIRVGVRAGAGWWYRRARVGWPGRPGGGAGGAGRDPLAAARRLLGVPPDAGLEEVRRAFRRRCKEWHPDCFATARPELQAEAHRRFVALQGARDQLVAHLESRKRGGGSA